MELKRLATAVVLLAYVPFLGIAAATSAAPRSKNGFRMVGISGPHGRLEVSTKDQFFPGVNGSKPVWVPVCSSGFSDSQAEIACKVLGYSYGRMYNLPRVVYPPKPVTGYTARYLSCDGPRGNAHHRSRRQLHAASAAVGQGADPFAHDPQLPQTLGGSAADSTDSASSVASSQPGGRRSILPERQQRSLAYRFYNVAIPARLPYTCRFLLGDCGPNGSFAGIECANTPMPDAPPPPPSPPSPPPYSDSIRLSGGSYFTPTEPNLCPSPEYSRSFGRVELLVPAPNGSGSQIWAPLCAAESASLRATIARVACQQAFDWPSLKPMPPVMAFPRTPNTEPFAFALPQGPADASAGEFDPATFQGWVTISNLTGAEPSMLQDGNLAVSATPCQSLFALTCTTLYARRA